MNERIIFNASNNKNKKKLTTRTITRRWRRCINQNFAAIIILTSTLTQFLHLFISSLCFFPLTYAYIQYIVLGTYSHLCRYHSKYSCIHCIHPSFGITNHYYRGSRCICCNSCFGHYLTCVITFAFGVETDVGRTSCYSEGRIVGIIT